MGIAEADAYILERREELCALAAALIAHKTPSPPGRNTEAVQDLVAGRLRSMGFSVERFEVYPKDPDVVGVLPKTDASCPSLLLNGHIDVAEVGDLAHWLGDPFTPFVKQGRLYGRGAADMKGGLAAGLFALEALVQSGVELKGGVVFESVIGEEQGEAGTEACVSRGYTADFAVCLDCTGLCMQGQGGVITGWITLQAPGTLHDGMRGRMLHAGGGVFGAGAIEKMARIIDGLGALERHWAVMKSAPGFPPGASTINPAVIEGGRHPAFIADRCSLWITVHFYPGETHEAVTAEIERHVLAVAAADPWMRANPPTFRWGGRSMIEERGEVFPPVPLPSDHPAFAALADAHREVAGRPPEVAMSPSVTDAGWLSRAGIPTVIYGPGELAEAHRPNESVAVDDLVTAARVMARFAGDWTGNRRPGDGMTGA